LTVATVNVASDSSDANKPNPASETSHKGFAQVVLQPALTMKMRANVTFQVCITNPGGDGSICGPSPPLPNNNARANNGDGGDDGIDEELSCFLMAGFYVASDGDDESAVESDEEQGGDKRTMFIVTEEEAQSTSANAMADGDAAPRSDATPKVPAKPFKFRNGDLLTLICNMPLGELHVRVRSPYRRSDRPSNGAQGASHTFLLPLCKKLPEGNIHLCFGLPAKLAESKSTTERDAGAEAPTAPANKSANTDTNGTSWARSNAAPWAQPFGAVTPPSETPTRPYLVGRRSLGIGGATSGAESGSFGREEDDSDVSNLGVSVQAAQVTVVLRLIGSKMLKRHRGNTKSEEEEKEQDAKEAQQLSSEAHTNTAGVTLQCGRKGLWRLFQKAYLCYNGDFGKILDVVRGRLVCATLWQLKRCIAVIRGHEGREDARNFESSDAAVEGSVTGGVGARGAKGGSADGATPAGEAGPSANTSFSADEPLAITNVVRFKDLISDPSCGFRGVVLSVQLAGYTHICELQLTHTKILAAQHRSTSKSKSRSRSRPRRRRRGRKWAKGARAATDQDGGSRGSDSESEELPESKPLQRAKSKGRRILPGAAKDIEREDSQWMQRSRGKKLQGASSLLAKMAGSKMGKIHTKGARGMLGAMTAKPLVKYPLQGSGGGHSGSSSSGSSSEEEAEEGGMSTRVDHHDSYIEYRNRTSSTAEAISNAQKGHAHGIKQRKVWAGRIAASTALQAATTASEFATEALSAVDACERFCHSRILAGVRNAARVRDHKSMVDAEEAKATARQLAVAASGAGAERRNHISAAGVDSSYNSSTEPQLRLAAAVAVWKAAEKALSVGLRELTRIGSSVARYKGPTAGGHRSTDARLEAIEDYMLPLPCCTAHRLLCRMGKAGRVPGEEDEEETKEEGDGQESKEDDEGEGTPNVDPTSTHCHGDIEMHVNVARRVRLRQMRRGQQSTSENPGFYALREAGAGQLWVAPSRTGSSGGTVGNHDQWLAVKVWEVHTQKGKSSTFDVEYLCKKAAAEAGVGDEIGFENRVGASRIWRYKLQQGDAVELFTETGEDGPLAWYPGKVLQCLELGSRVDIKANVNKGGEEVLWSRADGDPWPTFVPVLKKRVADLAIEAAEAALALDVEIQKQAKGVHGAFGARGLPVHGHEGNTATRNSGGVGEGGSYSGPGGPALLHAAFQSRLTEVAVVRDAPTHPEGPLTDGLNLGRDSHGVFVAGFETVNGARGPVEACAAVGVGDYICAIGEGLKDGGGAMQNVIGDTTGAVEDLLGTLVRPVRIRVLTRERLRAQTMSAKVSLTTDAGYAGPAGEVLQHTAVHGSSSFASAIRQARTLLNDKNSAVDGLDFLLRSLGQDLGPVEEGKRRISKALADASTSAATRHAEDGQFFPRARRFIEATPERSARNANMWEAEEHDGPMSPRTSAFMQDGASEDSAWRSAASVDVGEAARIREQASRSEFQPVSEATRRYRARRDKAARQHQNALPS
jgi:hypothetical protein